MLSYIEKKHKCDEDDVAEILGEEEVDSRITTSRNIVVHVAKEVTRRKIKANKIQERIKLILSVRMKIWLILALKKRFDDIKSNKY